MRNKFRCYLPFYGNIVSRGSFQAIEFIPKEWGWPDRLRPRITNRSNSLDKDTVNTVDNTNNINLPIQVPILPNVTDNTDVSVQRRTVLRDLHQTHIDTATSQLQHQKGNNISDSTPLHQQYQQQPTAEHVPKGISEDSINSNDTTLPVHAIESNPDVTLLPPPAQPPPGIQTRSGRQVKPNLLYNTNIIDYAIETHLNTYKVSVKQALKSDHSQHAIDAIKAEIDYMINFKVGIPTLYENIDYEHRKNIIPAHMFLKWKIHPNGQFDKVKARLVAGGDKQGIETYDDTSSPTINPITVMAILNLMTCMNMECTVYDIKGAFLSVPVEVGDPVIYILLNPEISTIWCRFYPEYIHHISKNRCLYLKLSRYIYGLKQASNKFRNHLAKTLLMNGYKQLISDECVFTKGDDTYKIIIGSHVDDLIVTTPQGVLQPMIEFENLLLSKWEINKQEGDVIHYIGLTITRDRINMTTSVSQQKLLNELITKYHLPKMHSRSTPMNLNYPNTIRDITVTNSIFNRHEFLSLIMTLMYLARFTRPDILFAVTYLATKSEAPTHADMHAALNIIAYLNTTGNMAYQFTSGDIFVRVYVDASHGIHVDGRGHTGIFITLGSAPVVARSVKQKIVALHSTDAEIIAVTESLTYVIWLRLLLSELDFEIVSPIPIYQDNTSAIFIYNGGGKFKRSKHMLIKQSYVKDLIDKKIVDFHYLKGTTIPTDPITKPVPGPQLQNMIKFLSMVNIS
jgi:hypothetical protein